MSERLLEVLQVRLFRGGREVLRGVTFHARPGEIVALMGPSGSGKTSILRVIAGLEPFHSGSVQIGDVVLDGPSATTPQALRVLRRKIGMVFQFHHLFEHLTALKNVWLAPVHAHGISFAQAQERAWHLLGALGVEHRAHALPRELSGGEAQRVAIARALAVDPPLLLMDEPTAALDAARRAELRDLLRGLEKGETLGFMKVIVAADTKEILGAVILGLSGDEVIQTLLDVMCSKAPYTTVSRAMHIHPTVSELLPTLLQDPQPLV